ncbi:hypothetical protein DL769_003616 [Monosporascus sp. CRB-8-3]|nr:hypothetical protein DL769_003616 [Monosporascus sp. CRB-8-3]
MLLQGPIGFWHRRHGIPTGPGTYWRMTAMGEKPNVASLVIALVFYPLGEVDGENYDQKMLLAKAHVCT